MMRVYRWLLHLYPASFRLEYGEEMCHVFAERQRLASGSFALVLVWLDTVRDVVLNATNVHADILRQDLHYTARTLSRTPGFTVTAALVTALGIGANTAAFSIMDRVFLRPLPFEDADRLVKLWERLPEYPRMEASPPNYRDWQSMSTSFSSMGAFTDVAVNLIGHGDPERIEACMVTAEVFPTLGVEPALGRVFVAGEDRTGAPGTVVLSDALWRSVFGADPAIVGRTVRLDQSTFTVIGVMPRGFSYPYRDTELWMPFPLDRNTDRTDNYLQVVARLKPGVSLDAARAEMTTIAARLERAYPKENEKTGASVFTLRGEISRQARLLLVGLFGASACLLLIACTNLASLLLTRFLGRRLELSVRAAMGAGRERLVRQLLTETLVLSVVGGALGIALAIAGVPLLAKLAPPTLPIGDPQPFDVRVLTFAFAMTLVTGLGFGVVPALRVCRGADASALRDRSSSGISRRGEWLRGALVLAEITASIVLLIASGLLVRALWRVQAIDPGFKAERVLTLETPLPMAKYGKTNTRVRFYDQVLADTRAIPGVTDAAYISFLPMVMRGGIWPVNVRGGAQVRARGAADTASLRFVTPGFFAVLGIPIRLGRDIGAADQASPPFAAVVSESFARRYWPDRNPLGRAFTLGDGDALGERIVVGVVGDIRVRGLERDSEPQVYLAYTQVPDNAIIGYLPKDLVIKTVGDPIAVVPAVRSIVKKADPELPISDVRTLADIVDGETAPRRTQVRVLVAFVAIAMLLAAVGIHGLLSFGVSRRRSEIGLRVALGAQRADVLRMILREGLVLAACGSAIGMVLAYAVGRTMESLLAGIRPTDAITFTAAAVLSVAMTISGSVVPALRALGVDPATALRTE